MRKTFLFFYFKMNFGISKVHHNFFRVFYYSGFDDTWGCFNDFLMYLISIRLRCKLGVATA